MNKNFILKNYIYYLLQVLNIINDLNEVTEILNFYINLFMSNNSNLKINNKLKVFLLNYRKIKILLVKKQNKIFYNKIYKILFELNKLSKMNDINELLNFSLLELNKKNMFLNLPYDLEVCVILKKK